ncbi:hypothetical protein [Streptomyces sp. NPDC018693]|uniref:hypothetical protein n=1 Tax=unclassified Streptomyces TaxID=2593676 RepID=UPI00378E58FF
MSDITRTLALLPPEEAGAHLADLCAILGKIDPINAVSVANALLDVVFPTEAYQAGDPLTDAQRAVIHTIADSTNAWTFSGNLHEVLRRNGLPTDADRLRALADGTPGSEPADVS